jgi:hypothetical protein
MRKFATAAAFLALLTVQAGATAQVSTAGPGSVQSGSAAGNPAGAGGAGERMRPSDPRFILISLAGLTTFTLGFVAAVKKNGGRPASP